MIYKEEKYGKYPYCFTFFEGDNQICWFQGTAMFEKEYMFLTHKMRDYLQFEYGTAVISNGAFHNERFSARYVSYLEDGNKIPNKMPHVVLAFKDKNDALQFKLKYL